MRKTSASVTISAAADNAAMFASRRLVTEMGLATASNPNSAFGFEAVASLVAVAG